MELYENTIEKKEIFNGRIIDVSIHTVELPNGKTSTREIVTHPGAVAILAFNDENKVLMVKQFRKPFDEVLLEIPAGDRKSTRLNSSHANISYAAFCLKKK